MAKKRKVVSEYLEEHLPTELYTVLIAAVNEHEIQATC